MAGVCGRFGLELEERFGRFLLFRLFDIWKLRRAATGTLHGGVGIVADDLMAGLYAALVLWLAGWFNLY